MHESHYYQPQRLEEFLLENNAMLQTIIHNQAAIVQHSVGTYSLLYEFITKKRYRNGDPMFEANSRQLDEKLNEYKKLTDQMLTKNIEILKRWQERTIH